MSLLLLFSAALLGLLSSSPSFVSTTEGCLPAGIKATDIVSSQAVKPGPRGQVTTITVAQKLKELRARCRRRKLVDAKGREIRFYPLIGCWGNPPDDYQERLERQAQELANLRKRYRVIEISCNRSPSQIM